ncbi:MAG TPA: T9SS type A sorting domain-containing protein [Candidatus Kapabacteria bacterium]|nr:T9SS type A sorting domain-containing protein [Candidatus Kapabacteria bacterium]
MKKFNIAFTALLALLLVSGVSFAQRGGGRNKGPFGRPDSTHHKPNPSDSLKKGPPPMGPFGLSDSCFQVFLTLIPADQAATLQDDMAQMKTIQDQLNALRKQFKDAVKARDTAAIHDINAKLKDLFTQANTLKKAIDVIIRANQAILMQVRKDCMGFVLKGPGGPGGGPDKDTNRKDDTTGHHKGAPGGGGDPARTELKVTPVTPNPVPTGVQASFTYTTVANADGSQTQVNITISDAMGTLVKNVFAGGVDAGDHLVNLDLSGLTKGVYILRIQAGNAVVSQKLLIQ